MKTHDILRDAASRPGIEAAVAVKGLSAEALKPTRAGTRTLSPGCSGTPDDRWTCSSLP